MSYVIGLTGGIGCGKSLVSRYLRSKNFTVIDADQIARQIMEPGSPGLEAAKEAFGLDILQADGSLNRQKLGGLVFQNQNLLEKLNAITHPLIRQAIQDEIKKHAQEALVIVDIPLLFESGGYEEWVDEIWVVSASEAQQIQRIRERDGLTAQQAQARLDAQWPIAQKVALADFVIDNSALAAQTYQQVDKRLREMVMEKKF